jgi:hypothetical protein
VGKLFLCLAALLLGTSAASVLAFDRDGDGIEDELEQALLERFLPRFFIDERECAGRPSEFLPFSNEPRASERNGTIYAGASPSSALGPDQTAVELHYYHLWDLDCGGLNGRELDVEHVSALVTAASREGNASEWRARYWYAAAHEGTVCDASNAARADALDAAETGPTIWISRAKHASFLSEDLCRQRGCGGDACGQMVPLPTGSPRNVGEAGAPLGGALWIDSSLWPLREKLETDFDRELLDRLDTGEDAIVARIHGHWRPAQFSLSIGGDALGALDSAGDGGGGAVEEADEQIRSALGKTLRAIGQAFEWMAKPGSAVDHDEP